MTQALVFLNGVVAKDLSVFDRGLQFGDGVFETILFNRDSLYLADRHWSRLKEGLARLSIDCSINRVEQELSAYFAQLALTDVCSAVVKIIVTRGSSQRGYKSQPGELASVVIWSSPHQDRSKEQRSGVTVRLCKQRLGLNPQLAGIKHLNRLEQVLARAEWWGEDIFEGLMLGQKGNVVEGIMSNVFIVHEGRLLTPDLSECGVAGTMRAEILERIAPNLGLDVDVRAIDSDDLSAASEFFICNSVMGIVPVTRCADAEWHVGAISKAVQETVYAAWDS